MVDHDGHTHVGTLGASSRAVLRELLISGPLHRATLARRLGHSAASLTKITRPLLDSGVLTTDETLRSDLPGRPGTPLDITAEHHTFAGFKITGSSVHGVMTNARGEVRRGWDAALSTTDPEHVVALIVDQVKEMEAERPLQAIGIGSAGMMRRYDDRVRQNQYLGWDDVPLAEIITERTGRPTVVSVDTRALTAGVHWSGPGRGLTDFAVVTIGVGVGLGLVIDDHLHAGTDGLAGMIGHLPVNGNGPLCAAGHRGCVSSFLNSSSITSSVALAHSRSAMTLEEVVELADDGDPAAVHAFDQGGVALGTLIFQVISILGLQHVILTGDGLPALRHLRAPMDRSLRAHLDPHRSPPEIAVFHSDFDEWARGAAVLACQWLLLSSTPPTPRKARS